MSSRLCIYMGPHGTETSASAGLCLLPTAPATCCRPPPRPESLTCPLTGASGQRGWGCRGQGRRVLFLRGLSFDPREVRGPRLHLISWWER